MRKLVSIIIPAYNAEKWIEETIKSAIYQSYPCKEVIIIDDGSKDNTLNIAKKYQSNSVIVISQKNKGVCSARNIGLAMAKGDYIQWLDADDLLEKDKISYQMKYCEGDNHLLTLLSSSFGFFYFSCNRAKFIPDLLWQDLKPIDWIMYKLSYNYWMNPAVWLVSRKLTDLAGPWNENLIRDNDGEYFFRIVSCSDYIKFEQRAKSYYRVGNSQSITQNRSKLAMESLFSSINICINRALELENTDRIRISCVMYLQNLLPFFYPEQTEILEKIYSLGDRLGGSIYPPKYNLKFNIIKNMFSIETALYLKNKSWLIENKIKKGIDNIYFKLYNN